MKKLASILFVLLFISGLAYAAANPVGSISADARASKGGTLSATATPASLSLNHNNLYLEVLSGGDEVYFNFNDTVDADSNDFYLVAGNSITLHSAENRKFRRLGYDCAAGESATVLYLAWD